MFPANPDHIWTIHQQGKKGRVYDHSGTDHKQVLSDYLTIKILRGGRLGAMVVCGHQFSIENNHSMKQFILRCDSEYEIFSLHEID
jgi:hypothetical protein